MPGAITIGNFDGVHAGHRALIRAARSAVDPVGRVLALAFDPHPVSVLRPASAPPVLEPFETRTRRLLDAGADQVERLSPTPDLLGMSPGEFVGWLIRTHRPDVIVEGPDFHFGKDRAGTVEVLRELAGEHGVRVEAVPPVRVTLRDQSEVIASSTMVRWLLGNGRVRDAAFVLGRPHELTGTVVAGDRIGRTIGFRTANIDTPCLPPQDGVYAAIASVPDHDPMIGAVHIGGRPTLDQTARRVEAHIVHPDGSAWMPGESFPDYGWACTLQLVGRIRDAARFDGLDALKAQLSRDRDRACAVVGPCLPTAVSAPEPS